MGATERQRRSGQGRPAWPGNAGKSPITLLHQPGLDGLRAVAVIAVFAHHAGIDGARGGFLGVDLFLVLSGYLITALLLAEREGTGTIDLVAFWRRRLRRLLPAVLVLLTAVVAYEAVVRGTAGSRLRGEALATLGYVANWRFVADGTPYFADLDPSPLRHTWTLAVEEQWYLVWPVLLLVALAVTGGRLRLVLVATVLAAGASIAVMAALAPHGGTDPSRVYYGTDTRAQALLVGAAVALVAHGRRPGRRARVALQVAGVAAAAVFVALVATVDGADGWMYRGGYLLVAAAGAALVTAAGPAGPGPVSWALARRPLPALGRVSYGVYLWHWPILVWRGLPDDAAGVAVAGALTLAVAAASYVLVEHPIRTGRVVLPLAVGPAFTVMVAAVVVAATVTTGPTRPEERLVTAEAGEVVTLPEPESTTDPIDPAPSARAPVEPAGDLVVALVGDSVALTLGLYSGELDGLEITGAGLVGCGMDDSAVYVGDDVRPADACAGWDVVWREAVASTPPDLVVVMVGAWEVLDRDLEGERQPAGSPGWHDHLAGRLRQGVAAIRATDPAVPVAVATVPCMEPSAGVDERGDGDRVAAVNQMLRGVASADGLPVIDLGAHVCPDGEVDQAVRPDGAHYTPESAPAVWRWLAPQVRAAAR